MMVLEHDAKELLAADGLPVPAGFIATGSYAAEVLSLKPPWIVKAQVATGGRGKAGGIRRVTSIEALDRALADLQAMSIKGHKVRACRVEEAIDGRECYFSISLDAAKGRLNLLASAGGGVDVEANAASGAMLSEACAFSQDAALQAVSDIAGRLNDPASGPIERAARQLIPKFFAYEATLLEINPLFVRADGSWVAGDVKLVIDDNALARQPRFLDLVQRRSADYPEIALKLDSGFDYIELDPEGEIGLVTTGAGLSMQLVDELSARGCRVLNFCDIRTGQFRGDPKRLVQVLQWIAAGRSVRAVLINFFAGITDLAEIAQLLIVALKAVPELHVPVTVRLIGNGFDKAIALLDAAGSSLRVERDLDKAVEIAIASFAGSRP